MSDSQFQSDVRFVETGSDTETPPPQQRRYTAAYKLRLIDMADACTASGEVASLLRKEGIYSSTLTDFRKQKVRGDLDRKVGRVGDHSRSYGGRGRAHGRGTIQRLPGASQSSPCTVNHDTRE